LVSSQFLAGATWPQIFRFDAQPISHKIPSRRCFESPRG
jgi:hypothetical protein